LTEDQEHTTHVTRLAAIMFTDIVGYTALMGKNSKKALELLHKNREIHKPVIKKHHGKWLKEMGDGILVQFDSAVDSVRCAIEIQKRAREELDGLLRIGIHLGDVTIENDDVFGDGVNIASRLQSIADPGGIYISDSIQQAIRANEDIQTEYFGAIQLKNVDYLLHTYYISEDGFPVPGRSKKISLSGGVKKSIFKSAYTYLLAFLVIIIAAGGWWFKNRTSENLKSIAVLPVENLSQKTDQEWLSAGIHHALIDELCKIHSLRVVSRTSSLKYQDSEMAIPEIARELNVDGVVEASYYTEGENLKLQVRLIRASPEERQIWRQSYDRAMQNVYSVYNDVVKSVAEAGNILMTEKEETRLNSSVDVNPEAYEAYLRGMSHWEQATESDMDKAMDYFSLAKDLDPEYPLAYMGIASVWGGRLQHGYISYDNVKLILEETCSKALELDSSLAEVHGWMAVYNGWWAWNFDKAAIEFAKAIELNPNYSFVLAYYSHYLAFMGNPETGLPYAEKATELDPFNPLYKAVYGMALKNARQYNKAASILEDLIKAEPNHGIGLPALWSVYHEMGNYSEAIDLARRIFTIKKNSIALDALNKGYEKGGYKMAMQEVAEEMISVRDSSYFPSWQICTLFTRAQNKEETLKWLQVAYEEHDPNLPYISVDPLFDFVRGEPLFKEILHKMKLPEINFN